MDDESTAQGIIAAEIWGESDLWDLDDMGMQAAADIIARLKAKGFTIVGPVSSTQKVSPETKP